MISWSLQLLRILKKQQQGKAIRKKEKKPYLDENDSLMHNGRTVTAPQQIASGVIKQARSVENLQGLSRDRLSFFRSTSVHCKPGPYNANWYHKVVSSRPVYYSILNSFGQRYISIKFPLHKRSENP